MKYVSYTRTLIFLWIQVLHPFDLPGTPTIPIRLGDTVQDPRVTGHLLLRHAKELIAHSKVFEGKMRLLQDTNEAEYLGTSE